ncbi:TPA: M20 family peptidase [Candidatus Geothermarchaeota archaeon]|nr:M20 family peptidase [Candidatus Geothermarchaeota archaeon]
MTVDSKLDMLLSRGREYEDELINFLSGFIQVKSVNPPGDVREAAEYVQSFLSKWGLQSRWIEPKEGVVTIYSNVGGEDYIMLNGHMDVVPEGDHSRWTYPPYSGKIVDGYVYGRGASDMKGGLSALIFAYAVFTNVFDKFDRGVSLAAVGDEEVGGQYGSLYIAEELGIKPNYVLLGEPSTLNYYNIGEKGIVWYRVKVAGEPAHASVSPYAGDNAILKAGEVIKEIYKLSEIDFEPPGDIRDIAIQSGLKAKELLGLDGIEKIFFRLSCNVGLINGGVKTNVVAPECTIDFDMRIPHAITVDDVLKLVGEKLSKFDGVSIEKISGHDPNYTNPETPLAKVIEESAYEEMGYKPKPSLVMGATDGRHFRLKGCDAVVYGPGEWSRIHGFDERIEINDVKRAFRVYLRILYRMLKP